MLRFVCPGIDAEYFPTLRSAIATLMRVSFVALMLSRKYSSVTFPRLFVAEKVQLTVTALFERITLAPSVV